MRVCGPAGGAAVYIAALGVVAQPAAAQEPTPEAQKTPFHAVIRGAAAKKEVVEQVLDAEEVKKIAGNANDTLKAVQSLPGVARPVFGSGAIVVWGSAPNDTLIYADGVPIPLLYHFGGLRSTLNAEFVSDISFRPGAYSADYGGGLGGVIDVTTRTPRADRLHGSVTLDLIDGSLTLSGPITSKLHFAAGARLSWISTFLPLFSLAGARLSPFYWDYQLDLRYQPGPRDDLDLFVFGSTDNVNVNAPNADPTSALTLGSRSYFSRARLRYVHRFGKDGTLTVAPSFGADSFSVDAGESGAGGIPLQLFVKQIGYNLRAAWWQRWHPLLETTLGLDASGLYTTANSLLPRVAPAGMGLSEGSPNGAVDVVRDARGPLGDFLGDSLFFSGDPIIEQKSAAVHQVQAAPYLIGRLRIFSGRLWVSPQLRLTVDALPTSQGGMRAVFAAEPRLSLLGEVISGRLWLDAGIGIYHQPPEAAQLAPGYGNPDLGLQFAATYVAGVTAQFTETLRLEVQGFYKDLRSLVVPSAAAVYDNGGTGRAYGGELLLRQKLSHNLFGWVAYTLSHAERSNAPGQTYQVFRYDQTHILTVLASYHLPRGFTIGARFRYVTGNPVTPTLGGIRDVVDQAYAAVLGAPYSTRLPDFHQLDVRIDKTFTFNRWRLGLFLDVQNVYNRANAESLAYGGRQLNQSAPFTGIPFFPDLGVRADF